nr:hypothetical protein [Brucella intermedia]
MSKIKTGGPAFPLAVETGPDFYGRKSHKVEQGATLRDYFAAKAMSAIQQRGFQMFEKHEEDLTDENIAREAYALADAMLAARGH